MPVVVSYKLPNDFPIYKRYLQLIEDCHHKPLVDWWHREVHHQFVDMLWSIINGTMPAMHPKESTLNDLVSWTTADVKGFTFCRNLFYRLECEDYEYGGSY